MRRRKKTTCSPPPGQPAIDMLKSPYVPPIEAFIPHDAPAYAGWRYAVHPIDKIDDPFRHRLTILSPAGERFTGWVKVSELEAGGIDACIDDSLAYIRKREAPHETVATRKRYAFA